MHENHHPEQRKIKNQFPHVLTWMEDSRSGNLTPGMNYCTESDFEVENTQSLHLNFNKQETIKHIILAYFDLDGGF